MGVLDAFERWLAAQDAAGTPMSACLRPPVDDATLRAVTAAVGELPADIVAWHRIADGVDPGRWNAHARGQPMDLVPGGPEWVDIQSAVEEARRKGRVSHQDVVAYLGDVDPEALWPSQLRLAYPIHSDECLAVETGTDRARLWVVRWQATEVRPLVEDLETVINRATDRFERLQCRWDPHGHMLDFDLDLEDTLPAFPDV